MKCIITFIFLLCLFSQAAFSLNAIQEKGYLRIAVYKEYPPFSFRDKGKLQGIDVELGKLLAKKLGVDPLIWAIGADESMEDDLRNTIWKGHYLGGGTADVMLHVPIQKSFVEDNDQVLIGNSYFKEEIIVTRHSSLASLPLIKLLDKHKVGVELDTLPDFYLLGIQGGRFASNVKHYKTVTRAVNAMINGEIKSVVAPRSQVETVLSGFGSEYISHDISMPRLYQSKWVVGMAVKKGRKGLMVKLNEALNDIKASGQLAELFNKYNISYIQP